MMRCDACGAMRWYGEPLRMVKVLEYPGPVEQRYLICAMCDEERMLSLSDGIDLLYAPTMHPPHQVKQ
jgi:hypothetical protein